MSTTHASIANEHEYTAHLRRERWIRFALIAITFFVYFQVWQFDFVAYDDDSYVFENPHVLSGLNRESVAWAFTTDLTGNWIPLTWLSLMFDAQLFGRFAGGFHFTNVLLHTANTLLLYAVFRRMTGDVGKSAFVAALFSIHPLHVESVAWVSERKDVLSTLFGLATIYGYVRSVESNSRPWHIASLACFACSLLAKQMLVTLPFVLLLLDRWPLNRFAPETLRERLPGLLREKIPFFVLTLVFCGIAYTAQHQGGNVDSLDHLSLTTRGSNAVVAYCVYLRKTVWPNDLGVFYPHPGNSLSAAAVAGSAITLLVISAAAFRQWRKRPYLTVGWLWFVGTLIPVIGVVQIGNQQLADRYTYFPIIGLFVGVAWWISSLFGHTSALSWRRPMGIAVVVSFAIAAHKQTGYWQNGALLFQRTLAVTGDDNFVAHYNLGNMLFAEQRLEESVKHYRRAMELNPNDSRPVHDLGVVLNEVGNTDQAIAMLKHAIAINPDDPDAYNNLGTILHQKGLIDAAVANYQQAIRRAPNSGQAYHNLAKAYEELDRTDEAETLYRDAIRLDPYDSTFQNSLGVFLILRRNNLESALACFREAVRLDPADQLAQDNLRQALELSK